MIRLSLLVAVLIFGLVIVFVHKQPNWTAGSLAPVVMYAQLAYAILAVSIAAALKGRAGREGDPQRRASLLLAGWAAGEGAALFGAVIFFITGQAQWYGIGLLAMICAFALLSPGAASPPAGNLDAPG
jgi:hypothetical protein